MRQGGQLRKVYFFVMALPHSDALFVQAIGHPRTEMFWEFRNRAFAYFGGVPRRISYVNEKVLVSNVIGNRARRLTDGFLHHQPQEVVHLRVSPFQPGLCRRGSWFRPPRSPGRTHPGSI